MLAGASSAVAGELDSTSRLDTIAHERGVELRGDAIHEEGRQDVAAAVEPPAIDRQFESRRGQRRVDGRAGSERGQPGLRAAREIVGDNRIAKVSVVGIGMRSHVGIASQMFRTLAEEGINIQMISTSEIKISVVIDEKYMELAVRALHRAFGRDQPT